MAKTSPSPEWINEKELCKWLDITPWTARRWRKEKGLVIANIGDKVMYDRNQLNQILLENSTYAFQKKSA